MPKPSQKLMPQQHAPSPRDLALQMRRCGALHAPPCDRCDLSRRLRPSRRRAVVGRHSCIPVTALKSISGPMRSTIPIARPLCSFQGPCARPRSMRLPRYFGFCDVKVGAEIAQAGQPVSGPSPCAAIFPGSKRAPARWARVFPSPWAWRWASGSRISPARVYTLLGDGELQEGEVWEAAMCAAHHKLDNLCAVIDYNKLQSDDRNDAIMRLEPLAAKWRAFDWAVAELTAMISTRFCPRSAAPRRRTAGRP